jgi:hypothetical protein
VVPGQRRVGAPQRAIELPRRSYLAAPYLGRRPVEVAAGLGEIGLVSSLRRRSLGAYERGCRGNLPGSARWLVRGKIGPRAREVLVGFVDPRHDVLLVQEHRDVRRVREGAIARGSCRRQRLGGLLGAERRRGAGSYGDGGEPAPCGGSDECMHVRSRCREWA